jgi:Zn-finger nucleic acid-binding protein
MIFEYATVPARFKPLVSLYNYESKGVAWEKRVTFFHDPAVDEYCVRVIRSPRVTGTWPIDVHYLDRDEAEKIIIRLQPQKLTYRRKPRSRAWQSAVEAGLRAMLRRKPEI